MQPAYIVHILWLMQAFYTVRILYMKLLRRTLCWQVQHVGPYLFVLQKTRHQDHRRANLSRNFWEGMPLNPLGSKALGLTLPETSLDTPLWCMWNMYPSSMSAVSWMNGGSWGRMTLLEDCNIPLVYCQKSLVSYWVCARGSLSLLASLTHTHGHMQHTYAF